MDWRQRLALGRPADTASAPLVPWYRIRNEAGSDETDIYLYDVIGGWWGVEASTFVRELMAIDAATINLHINSPGGDVFDAFAIYQALRNHKARIVTHVDSLAASAASYIALAGDHRIVAPYGSLMIHNAWGLCVGDDADMAKMRDELDRLSNLIAQVYADRAGGDREEWRDLMRAETWFSAQEAVDAGLMHERQDDEEKPAESGTANRFDLSVFNYAGREHAPAPRFPRRATVRHHPPVVPAAEPDPSTTTEEGSVSTLNADVRQRLGLPDDADDASVLAALDEKLTTATDDPDDDEGDETAVVDEPQPEAKATTPTPAAKLPAGVVAIEQSALDDLRRKAELGAQAAERQRTEDRDRFIDAAIKAGKFAPARRDHWIRAYDADPEGTRETINGLAEGLVVPTTPVGHTGPAEPADLDAAWEAEMARLDGPVTTARKAA